VRRRLGVVATILRNPTLVRVLAAFLAFSIAEWATWFAVVIYAYERGGATEAGIIAFVQLLPSIVVAPAAGSLGDRFPRSRVLVATYVLQGVSFSLAAGALAGGLPAPAVYALATLAATCVTLTRPVQAALLPQVVDSADELTAANVTSAAIEGGGMLVGPALAGVLTAAAGPESVFAASGVALLAGALSLVSVARRAPAVAAAPPEARASVRRELAAGLVAIGSDTRLLALAAVLGCALLLLATLDIFYAVLAFDLLDLGESGLGLLAASTGAGVVAGSAVAVTLVGKSRLGGPILAAAVGFGAAIMLLGLAPGAAVSALLLAASGVAFQYVYVAVQTATQRVAPDMVLTRVFGVFEALRVAVSAVGALAVPVMVALFGASGAFVVSGLSLPVVAVLAARALRRMDRTAFVRAEELRLLQGIPMFAPLAAPVLEGFAASVARERFASGSAIIRQGDAGDRYFIIVRGSVSVEIDGRVVGTEGPGEGFGEIALLRDMPRTATVRALDDVEALTLGREPFLAGLTGLPASRAAAERVVERRLAGSR
jgi:MFS family permease